MTRTTCAAAALAAASLIGPGPVPAEPTVQTLEDIRIEGEVRLPRVLFITSRETERPVDFLDHFAPDASVIADDLATPGPIIVLHAEPVPAPIDSSTSTPRTAAPAAEEEHP